MVGIKIQYIVLWIAMSVMLAGAEEKRPNIVWIFAEDTSPWMGCYGDEVNKGFTPNIDSIANAGIRFDNAFVPAPVCSPCRSAMMLGTSSIRFGAQEHRSSRSEDKDALIYLPDGMKMLPRIMKEAGYTTYNHGKTDYNFVWDEDATYSKLELEHGTAAQPDCFETLKKHQPFFIQLQTMGGKINTGALPEDKRTDPASVTVPADYPQNELYHDVVTQHYNAMRADDIHIGKILKAIKEAGLSDNTVVVYFSDHGANHLLRHKQMVTEGGLHVPFMVMGPEKFVPKQGVRKDLINALDLSATTLAWAGIPIPDWYEGQDLFADHFKPRKWVAGAKDRMDWTIDRVRTIRTEQFRYTHNYKLDRIFLQPQYRDHQKTCQNLHALYRLGRLPDDLKRIYFGERPAEEFYDVVKDPAQVHNLIDNPKYAKEVKRHRQLLDAWLAKGDTGAVEETKAQTLSITAGSRKGVNPEYEIYRNDSDGDGFSDNWEKIYGRNQKDGQLIFEFDCGGWQTGGWESEGIPDNIAGYLGFLDFTLGANENRLIRKGLKAKVNKADQALLIKLRSGAEIKLQAFANGKPLLTEPKSVDATDAFTELRIPLKKSGAWKGTIESLELTLAGKAGTFIEIDSIIVERNGVAIVKKKKGFAGKLVSITAKELVVNVNKEDFNGTIDITFKMTEATKLLNKDGEDVPVDKCKFKQVTIKTNPQNAKEAVEVKEKVRIKHRRGKKKKMKKAKATE